MLAEHPDLPAADDVISAREELACRQAQSAGLLPDRERKRDIKRKHPDRAFQPECRAWWRFALVSASCRAWTGAMADYEQIKCGSNWILLPVFMILIYNRLGGLDLGKNNKSIPLAFINTQKRSRQRTRDKRKRTFQFIWWRELTESWQKRELIKSSEVGFTSPPERKLQT